MDRFSYKYSGYFENKVYSLIVYSNRLLFGEGEAEQKKHINQNSVKKNSLLEMEEVEGVEWYLVVGSRLVERLRQLRYT